MTEDSEIDVDALRAELEQIKDAIGLRDRYPSLVRLWLVYGVLVAVASAGSQYVALQDLPEYWHGAIWFVTMSVGGGYQWYAGDRESRPAAAGKPNVLVQFGAILALYFVFVTALSGVDLPPETGEIVVFAVVVALVGTAYLVMAESLRAYYIRRRDRLALAVGGLWMLGFAALAPNVEFLRTWGYAVFGGCYAAYAAGAYLVLSGGGANE